MPNQPISPPQGVFSVPTPLVAGNRWVASNLIRFLSGAVQKLGGSSRLTSQQFVGICRGLRPFFDLAGNSYIGIGTTDRLQIYLNGTISDITPIRATSEVAGPFTTVAGSATITVTDSVQVVPGDWVDIANAIYFQSLEVQGFVSVAAVGSGTWTFVNGATASASASSVGSTATLTTVMSSPSVRLTNGGGFVYVNGSTFDLFDQVVVGGVTITPGPYEVVVSGGTATITGPGPASSSASVLENGGSADIRYLLETAVEAPTSGSGPYGGGPYGVGPYGVGSSANEPIGGWQRQWSLDIWGSGNENLIACPTGGGIYEWTPPLSVANTATLVTNAPTENTGVFTTMPAQQLMAFGAFDVSAMLQNPLLLRWTDVGDNTVWVASATNQAGSYQIPLGSEIICAAQDDLQVLIWTDTDLWAGQYLGFPLVWGFQRIGRACGLLAKRALCKIGGVWFWLGTDSFWAYDGTSVQPLPCSVWDVIFGAANLSAASYLGDIFVGADEQFGEFFTFFPTPDTAGVCLQYVKFNRTEGGGTWDYGLMPPGRSAWTDLSRFGNPVAADYTGLLQQHETSTDLDGQPMDSWVQTGWLSIAEGDEFMSVRRILTDFKVLAGVEALLVTVLMTDYTNGNAPIRSYGPFMIGADTPYIFLGARGRYMALKIESNALGTVWRAGKFEPLIRADGKRGG